MIKNNWNATLYEGKHSFIWQYAENLLELLSPKSGERILDLGCGTGQLTEQISRSGTKIMGIDSSQNMIEKARQNYPDLHFNVADARNFQVDRSFDAVFSNATLHWVPEADAVIDRIYQSLKAGGRFVAEFGGKGNVQAITTALSQALREIGITQHNPWYFPSIGDYASKLEKRGFDVTYAVLLPRPTPLADGEAGLRNWIEMFGDRFFTGITEEEKTQIICKVEKQLRPTLYQEGTWIADYWRIRVVAIKPGLT